MVNLPEASGRISPIYAVMACKMVFVNMLKPNPLESIDPQVSENKAMQILSGYSWTMYPYGRGPMSFFFRLGSKVAMFDDTGGYIH